ncbi:M15 family metallopeptidase [Agreia sp.]|uniref:M15 family metallopeptidase n=1 Tax=Agreia sp. TaxID=1872416 RepID=UPI0035BC6A68
MALAIAAGALAFSLLALSLFSVIPAKAAVNAAADSAAIAAAESASASSVAQACAIADQAASLNRATLLRCEVAGGEATVTVGRQILETTFSVTARAAVPRPEATAANGAIPAADLVLVSYPGVRESPAVYLRADAAAALLQLLEAYHAQTDDYLPVDEGYRSLEDQHRLFDQYGWPRAAIPGTSNHGEGIAVDFVNPPVVRGATSHSWLAANAARFGFSPLTDPDEPWHWDYTR